MKHEIIWSSAAAARLTSKSKITITLIVAIAVVLTALLITGFIYKEQKQQLESTQYRLKGQAI